MVVDDFMYPSTRHHELALLGGLNIRCSWLFTGHSRVSRESATKFGSSLALPEALLQLAAKACVPSFLSGIPNKKHREVGSV